MYERREEAKKRCGWSLSIYSYSFFFPRLNRLQFAKNSRRFYRKNLAAAVENAETRVNLVWRQGRKEKWQLRRIYSGSEMIRGAEWCGVPTRTFPYVSIYRIYGSRFAGLYELRRWRWVENLRMQKKNNNRYVNLPPKRTNENYTYVVKVGEQTGCWSFYIISFTTLYKFQLCLLVVI